MTKIIIEIDLETKDLAKSFNDYVVNFAQVWREQGRQLLEKQIQMAITTIEEGRSGCRQIRPTHFHSPLGTIQLQRRIYPDGCWADQQLSLPKDAWLPCILEMACALGVSSEFANAKKLFTAWTGVQISEHGLANQIEMVGGRLHSAERSRTPLPTAPLDSALSQAVHKDVVKPRIYVEPDGILLSLNKKQGYKEARVGVIFWEDDHLPISEKINYLRKKEYIATMDNRKDFTKQLYNQYTHVVQGKLCETVVIGDGARWIWNMAQNLYPGCIQILDFFHVCEYVWDVARAKWPDTPQKQRAWCKKQAKLLKDSAWLQVLENCQQFAKPSPELQKACQKLRSYLQNNAARIDYQKYLKAGYMIGSGVIESSNKKIVAMRLKQSGMHWSKDGANAVMTLRACYYSSSGRWDEFWRQKTEENLVEKPKRRHRRTSEKEIIPCAA